MKEKKRYSNFFRIKSIYDEGVAYLSHLSYHEERLRERSNQII